MGDPGFYYGWFATREGQGFAASPSRDLYLVGRDIYVLAYQDELQSATTGIYRVNIDSGRTERVCEAEASGFKIMGDTIFFTDGNRLLYRVPLAGGRHELLVGRKVSRFEVLGDCLYYALEETGELFALGKEESINPGGRLEKMLIQDGYLMAFFAKECESPIKMMIIDGTGAVIFKTMEYVELAGIANGRVVFVRDN